MQKGGGLVRGTDLYVLILPLIGIGSVHGLVTDKQREPGKCGKDPYYRILANQKIDRRGFLARFVKQYLLKDELFTPSADTTKCLVFDDTDLAKTGKTSEGIPKIYDHVSRTFYLGFKLLVAGYWNGSVFIPIDFSLHRDSKTSKLKFGLTAKQRRAQKNTPGCSTTVAANRFLEFNKKKTDLLAQMFSRVVKRRIPVDWMKWIDRDPFVNFKMNIEKKERSFLTDFELLSIENLSSSIERIMVVKDVFVFSCYTSISCVDIVQLTEDNIVIGIDDSP